MKKILHVALCGNPNVGKSTVFNALTGLRQHTGNWAGKTVETACGEVNDGDVKWQLVDLPGAYSLLNGSPEEIVASDYLMFQQPDVAIVVCDATCLERNLNLALQIMQICSRTVLCINMMDEAMRQGLTVDLQLLREKLNVPVAGISARDRRGLEELKNAVREAASAERPTGCYILQLPEPLAKSLAQIAALIDPIKATPAFAAQRALVCREDFLEKLHQRIDNQTELEDAIREQKTELLKQGYTREKIAAALIAAGYEAARQLCTAALRKASVSESDSRKLRLDKLLANKWLGLGLMICLLAIILFITIIGANAPSAWLSGLFLRLEGMLTRLLLALRLPEWLTDLLVSGVYRVTGWVISVMLPPMAIFFPLFTLLEDMGLLPRLAFNLDKCFQRCNACGKQALCMCMGLGCNAVGVTGCRIIQSPRERLIAILTNALVPCNGRFPPLHQRQRLSLLIS